jgi:hypothetical protein
MKEDKILKKIHQLQVKLRKERKDLSWEKETKLITRVAKKVAQKYGYRIFSLPKPLCFSFPSDTL